jgi:hypothetical protein
MLAAHPLLAQSEGKACASLPEEKRRQTEACKTEEEKQEDAFQALVEQRADKEKPKHSSFLQWVHFDGLWVPAQSGASSYGLVGAHMTIADVKGANIFGPPGVMLVLDTRNGRQRLRPALTWGVSMHLTDFRLPGTERATQLYLNLTKCWTTGGYESGLTMAGLSVTFKQ